MNGWKEVLDVAGWGMASTGRHWEHRWLHPLGSGPQGEDRGGLLWQLASAVAGVGG